MRVVPTHLYGKTQHKTLQARISEDILHYREESLFYRTDPGKFFLRQFLLDPKTPPRFKNIYPARRRIRDLKRENVACIEMDYLRNLAEYGVNWNPSRLLRDVDTSKIRYIYEKDIPFQRDYVRIVVFIVVTKNGGVLSYRKGKYRSDLDTLDSEKSIGFIDSISDKDRDLFRIDPLGIINSSVRALEEELGLTADLAFECRHNGLMSISAAIHTNKGAQETAQFGFVVVFSCPQHFEPTKRRLAINDLRWMSLAPRPNRTDDFDVWSQLLIAEDIDASTQLP